MAFGHVEGKKYIQRTSVRIACLQTKGWIQGRSPNHLVTSLVVLCSEICCCCCLSAVIYATRSKHLKYISTSIPLKVNSNNSNNNNNDNDNSNNNSAKFSVRNFVLLMSWDKVLLQKCSKYKFLTYILGIWQTHGPYSGPAIKVKILIMTIQSFQK